MKSDPIDLTLAHIRPDRLLHYENYQVVSLVQALWGAISENMVAISLKCVGADIHLHFYLESESSFDRELINEVADDLEALQFTSIPINAHITIAARSVQPAQIDGRLVYRRHEPRTSDESLENGRSRIAASK